MTKTVPFYSNYIVGKIHGAYPEPSIPNSVSELHLQQVLDMARQSMHDFLMTNVPYWTQEIVDTFLANRQSNPTGLSLKVDWYNYLQMHTYNVLPGSARATWITMFMNAPTDAAALGMIQARVAS